MAPICSLIKAQLWEIAEFYDLVCSKKNTTTYSYKQKLMIQ